MQGGQAAPELLVESGRALSGFDPFENEKPNATVAIGDRKATRDAKRFAGAEPFESSPFRFVHAARRRAAGLHEHTLAVCELGGEGVVDVTAADRSQRPNRHAESGFELMFERGVVHR